jgi:hypothetical protein
MRSALARLVGVAVVVDIRHAAEQRELRGEPVQHDDFSVDPRSKDRERLNRRVERDLLQRAAHLLLRASVSLLPRGPGR